MDGIYWISLQTDAEAAGPRNGPEKTFLKMLPLCAGSLRQLRIVMRACNSSDRSFYCVILPVKQQESGVRAYLSAGFKFMIDKWKILHYNSFHTIYIGNI